MVDVIGRYAKPGFPEKTLEQLTELLKRARSSEGSTQRSKVQILSPRNIRKRLGDQALVQLIAEYRKGDTTITLMERYGLSKTAVLKVLRDHGVKMRRQPLTDEHVSVVIQLYENGESLTSIERLTDHPRESIRRALIDGGLHLRARGGSKPRISGVTVDPGVSQPRTISARIGGAAISGGIDTWSSIRSSR